MNTSSPHISERDKRVFLIGGFLLLAVGAYFVGRNLLFSDDELSPAESSREVISETGVPFIETKAILEKVRRGDTLMLLDIRSEEAFTAEHIAQSQSVPIGSLSDISPAKKETTVVIVFSRNDIISLETAKNVMAGKSFPYFFLKGGFEGWQTENAPTISFGDPNSFADQSKVTYIPIVETKKRLTEKTPPLFILDVQTEEDFAKKHLRGAVNIPLHRLEERVGELPSGRQIIVYGANDVDSFRGGVRLFDLGIFSAKTLAEKGFLSKDSGLPLEP